MAESVVRFLLQKLDSLLMEEVRHLGGIRNDIVDFRDELEIMKAFLRDADALEDQDELLNVWVKQVRELAFDTEDVIDEFLLHFEHPRQPGLCGQLSKIGRAIKTLKARCRVAAELRQIKSNAISISERHKRLSLEGRRFSSGSRNDTQSLFQRRKDVRLVPEAQLVGIEEPKKELITWLLEDAAESRTVKVVAVQGMGGLGKTTIVNQVYIDAEVQRRFLHRSWITVSQSFKEHEVLMEIIKQLYKGIGQPVPEEINSMDLYSIKEDIKSFLCDKKYLIVVDDVWDCASWESLKYLFTGNNFGSCVMVTTRNRDVANFVTRVMFQGFVYPLKTLSSEESWNLFIGRVFQGGLCPPHLEEASRHIIERCLGLPLAIVSISGVLASKEINKEEWERVLDSFDMADSYNNNQLSDMEKIISLSFNDLPYDLKSCLMYLIMLPEDLKYDKDYWIMLWIAEGFVQPMGDKTPEEVGEFYVSELLSRSLIQESEDEDKWFKVHDLVRDILLRKCKEQNFLAITSDLFPIILGSVRRLSICTALEKLRGDHTLSKLRSLIFHPSKGFVTSSVSISEFLSYRGVRLLKVLDCSELPLETFPKFITTQYNLRFLKLSHTKVTSIPHSIGRLRKLETLVLEDTQVEELPNEILQIYCLRNLRAYRKTSEGSPPNIINIGVKVPTGIGTLTSLQTLFKIQVSKEGLELMKSLGELKQLRELHIQQLTEEHGHILCSSIEQMSHLRRLMMESKDVDGILDVQHISSPPSYLKLLVMRGRLMEIPSWVGKLQNLEILRLKSSKLIVDPLESLQALPNLVQLRFFDNAYDGEELRLRARGFQMLKELWLSSLTRLRRVMVEEGATPRLHILGFVECKLLEQVPLGIEFLTNLKELHFKDMGDQFVTRLRSDSDDSDIQRIKNVPSLSMGTWNADGKWQPYLRNESY